MDNTLAAIDKSLDAANDMIGNIPGIHALERRAEAEFRYRTTDDLMASAGNVGASAAMFLYTAGTGKAVKMGLRDAHVRPWYRKFAIVMVPLNVYLAGLMLIEVRRRTNQERKMRESARECRTKYTGHMHTGPA